jgi:hypothetical protein
MKNSAAKARTSGPIRSSRNPNSGLFNPPPVRLEDGRAFQDEFGLRVIYFASQADGLHFAASFSILKCVLVTKS